MFLREIGGNRYERKSFDADGTLTSRTLIDVGMPEHHDGFVHVPVSATVYDPEGDVERELNSRWICQQDGQRMVMPVLFVAEAKDSSMRLVIAGDPVIYPHEPPAYLEDLRLTIKSEKGILSWLPGKSVVRITDRHIADDQNTQHGRYTIKEELELKIVVLGIPFRKIRRQSEETIDVEKGLVRQVLKAPDGSTSVISLLPENSHPDPKK